jgi:hypothetical protein
MALARKSKLSVNFIMKFLDWRHSVNVMWNFSTILMLDKFVSFIGSCTFCTAEVESVEAEGLSDLRAGGHQIDNPHGQLATS